VPDALDTVKALAADYRRSSNTADDPDRAIRHSEHAKALEAAARELEEARKRLRPIPKDFGDLSDLPPEVIEQLNLSKVDELEQQIRDIVAAAEGEEVGIDQIIIGLYRRHKVVQERRFILNKLYRMGQKGLIHGVEGRKGVYFLPKPWPSSSSFADDPDDEVPF
jgi:hypothetical protein